MSNDLRTLINEHHAFYEVSTYHVVLNENPGHLPAKTRTIQAGFDVDIFGMNTEKEGLLPGADYAFGCAEAQTLADEVARQTNHCCSFQVIPFADRVTFGGPSHTELQAMVRIRISHRGGIEQPSGPPEEQALRELENQLKQLGISRH